MLDRARRRVPIARMQRSARLISKPNGRMSRCGSMTRAAAGRLAKEVHGIDEVLDRAITMSFCQDATLFLAAASMPLLRRENLGEHR